MELIKIGKVGKTHGFKGHLKIFIDEFYMDDFEEIPAIFIQNLPYFITHKDINTDNQAIVLLEDIDTKEKAQKLQGQDIFTNKENLTEILEEAEYDFLIGFEMQDKAIGKIGIIEEIQEMPFQILAKIKQDSKEILIPLNNQFIVEIKEKKKQIIMNLPDGLLDVF
jgi:16S rRNA processing protein RimM